MFQIPEREEVAAPQKAPDRVGKEEGLERILGLFEGDHTPILSVWFQGG